MFTLLALAIAGCSTPSSQQDTLNVVQPQGTVAVKKDPQKIVSFDFGSVDTLAALGAGQRVVGAADNPPPYLQPNGLQLAPVGSLKAPNLDAVRALSPDLILVTGRQGDDAQRLAGIAPTLDMSTGPDYLASVKQHITTLGELVGRQEQAKTALVDLQKSVDEVRAQVAKSGKKAIVLTHNEGRFSANEQPVIYSVLQAPRALPAPAPRAPGAPRPKPQPMTLEQIAAAQPDIIFIVDRSAAIGGKPLDIASLNGSALLKTPAAKHNDVFYLDPPLWYLSGGGLQSLMLQIEQIAQSY
ncbi:iron ABC transporter substrate-binding protein [Pseudomonas matsuisoli]|uniref:Iron ABC transporter substrate-binding protein n=1 Tax=Pseudomonas matsuisoli TaxID=1515666 RepID=A0A917PLJ5_9PSED|nr:iron ABC transporter substrate-binding protein [Pseudomonas matsuisoli]